MSGPSGVGKTSVVEGLRIRRPLYFSVSMTTRSARPGEVDGEDYHFVDRPRFEAAIENGELIEWAEYNGNLYGTPRASIMDHLDRGEDVILDIEIQGARQVLEAFPHAETIFVLPPSLDVLEARLRRRADTDEAAIAGRLRIAGQEMAEAAEVFEHLVVNDRLDAAIDEVVDILAAPIPDVSS